VTKAVLERHEILNPKLNVYITVMAEQALAEAKVAEEEIISGHYRGFLHGVPVGVKDLCATKGVRTTAGSKILADWIPEKDATVINKLREAGAIIIGKTHMHEFAMGAVGTNPHYGHCRNPWDTERIPGGSSSGSGAGVATGLFFAALGSDTGGSIRIPSSLCGIVGIKPTYGRVSLDGVVPLSWSLDHVGPMARTVRDCAIVMEAIAGYDPNDTSSIDKPVEDWASGLDGGIKGLRIGTPDMNTLENVESDVAALVSNAIEILEKLGAELIQLDMPFIKKYAAASGFITVCEAAAYHKDYMEDRSQDYGEDVRGRIQLGFDQNAPDFIQVDRLRDEARRTCDALLFSDVDLIAMPTTIQTAMTIESALENDPTIDLTRLTSPFNLTGQPALSLPCSLTDTGLPVGLQLIGRRFDERTLFRAAHTFEMESGLSRSAPPMN
jgi:aspartyl-tRNA(Asn)/glutamyl-tRNA(Gln) amidotransferase subunit A